MKHLTRAAAALVVLLAVTGCGDLSAEQNEQLKELQEQAPALKPYGMDLDAMSTAYTKIKDTDEAKVRPRLLGTVVEIVDYDNEDAKSLIDEAKLPEVAGAKVALVSTPKGWAVMVARSELNVKPSDVVEFTLPSASDFDKLDDTADMQTDLTELLRTGAVGIQSVRTDCETDMGKGVGATCNGQPAEFIVNANQFTQSTLDWLNRKPAAPQTA